MTLMLSKNATAPMTFADIGPLCVPREDEKAFSDNLIAGIASYEELAIFWAEIKRFDARRREDYFGPIMNRVWQLNGRPAIRNIIGQSKSTIDLEDIIKNRKILLVNLGRETEGKETAGFVGSLLLNSIWSIIQTKVASPDNPMFLYLDEFQDFINMPISPEDWFAQARSFGLAITVGTQYLSRLDRRIEEGVLNNARTKIIFQTEADDALKFARHFGRSVSEHDFKNQRAFEIIARIATSDGVSAPVTGITLPPAPRTGLANEALNRSRMKYARPVSEVESEIKARRQAPEDYQPEAPPKKGQRWGLEDDGRKL